MAKSSAAARTVDMFTGSTDEEAANQSDIEETKVHGAKSIEEASEIWRRNALFTQEHLSKYWNGGKDGTAKYRLTESAEGWWCLERFGLTDKGITYSWRCMTFPKSELYELAGCVVKAAKAKKAADDAIAKLEGLKNDTE